MSIILMDHLKYNRTLLHGVYICLKNFNFIYIRQGKILYSVSNPHWGVIPISLLPLYLSEMGIPHICTAIIPSYRCTFGDSKYRKLVLLR